MMDATMHGIKWLSTAIMLFVACAFAFDIYLSLRERSSRKAERKHFQTLDDKSMRTSVPTDLQ